MRYHQFVRPVAIAALCVITATCLPARGSSSARAVNFYSLEREIALGKQLAAELERQIKLVDDPILAEYVNRIAQNLARQSEIPIPVQVRIIESGDLNAFTLPGGHIYLNSGLLKLSESEAELAFVLAHELGHVAARHATRKATRENLLRLGSLPLGIFGGWSGATLRELAGTASKLGIHKGSRLFEAEADRLGVDFMDRAGYDPSAAIDMFERIEYTERKRPNALARLYEDHPVTAARINETEQHVRGMESHIRSVITTSEYEDMRLRALGVEERRIAQSDSVKFP